MKYLLAMIAAASPPEANEYGSAASNQSGQFVNWNDNHAATQIGNGYIDTGTPAAQAPC